MYDYIIGGGAAGWGFETTPQAGLKGRKGYQQHGKVLAGSSKYGPIFVAAGRQDFLLLCGVFID